MKRYVWNQRLTNHLPAKIILYPESLSRINDNLHRLQRGERPAIQTIGEFSPELLKLFNARLKEQNFPTIDNPEILFIGRHIFESRSRDGYQMRDIQTQIESFLTSCLTLGNNRTSLITIQERYDGHSSYVKDLGVFEISRRKPRAELYSIMPKGDKATLDLLKQKKRSIN